ncbi:MAG: hypothetical protein ABI553_00520 [Chloroflexota bacterium]
MEVGSAISGPVLDAPGPWIRRRGHTADPGASLAHASMIGASRLWGDDAPPSLTNRRDHRLVGPIDWLLRDDHRDSSSVARGWTDPRLIRSGGRRIRHSAIARADPGRGRLGTNSRLPLGRHRRRPLRRGGVRFESTELPDHPQQLDVAISTTPGERAGAYTLSVVSLDGRVIGRLEVMVATSVK